MIFIPKENFLGEVKAIRTIEHVFSSVTAYPDHRRFTTKHVHEVAHISMVLAGGNVEKRGSREIERTVGSVTFCDAGEAHQMTNICPGSVHVNLGICDGFLRKFEIQRVQFDKHERREVRLLMLKICHSLTNADPDSPISFEADLAMLLTSPYFRRGQVKPEWVETIREVLHDRWNVSISLNELSKLAAIHPVTLSSAFPKYFGCTIGQYRRKLRIDKALELLQRKDQSLAQISYTCGFADQSHFIRSIKSQIRWSPMKLQRFLTQVDQG